VNTLKEWIGGKSVSVDRENLISYVRSISKTPIISVDNLADYMTKLNELASWLPGNASRLGADDLKRALLQGHA
jgi:hypothetical protein